MMAIRNIVFGMLALWQTQVASLTYASSEATSLRVMSQNLYLGVNVAGILDPATIFNMPAKAGAMYQKILNSDYRERLAVLAGIIADRRPDLIGLQEVSLFMRQSPSDFYTGNSGTDHQVEVDYLALLLAELSALGAHYKAASIRHNARVEFPIHHEVGPQAVDSNLDDIVMLDRDVILARADLPITRTYARTFRYLPRAPIRSSAIGQIKRGFQAVTTEVNGKPLTFVNTHLEVGTPPPFLNYQYLQARELVSYLATINEPTIVAGDFNNEPNEERRSPYRIMHDAQLLDSWAQLSPADLGAGYTCCHQDDLRNSEASLDARIDYIYYRLPAPQPNTFAGLGLHPTAASLVNNQKAHKTSSGLWYSDHAGVLVDFAL